MQGHIGIRLALVFLGFFYLFIFISTEYLEMEIWHVWPSFSSFFAHFSQTTLFLDILHLFIISNSQLSLATVYVSSK